MIWVRRIIFLGLILSGLAFLAQDARHTRVEAPPGSVVITYWEKWSGREADQMREIVDAFNGTVGKEKRIWVRYLSMTAVDQKTLLATAAGAPPDVAGIWDAQITQFAALGVLERLDLLEHKPVFYDGCRYEGRLYALPSTPGVIALHYNKRLFEKKAAQLRAAGLDPDRAPRTIAELDRYAQILDTRAEEGQLTSAGYLPQEPGWWLALTPYWFDGRVYDPATRKITFTDANVIASYTWVQSYTNRLGAQTIQQFRSTLGKDNFDSPQSPFFTGAVAMQQEGAWKANYIAKLNPRMSNRRNLASDDLKKLTRQERRENCEWAAAPFPAVDANAPPVTYAGMDVLVIPSTSKHKAEAFEFVAFVNRQDQMEKLCSMHCKSSPLANMSKAYIENHPNPYIEVFEELAASPNARGLPPIPIWPEVQTELNFAVERICLGETTPERALAEAQTRAQTALDRFFQRDDQRNRKTQ
ncbi:MAG: extracellular solute-binding protein [Anaerolineae bacterium]|nr:extracellular solute-binding protein [Phycisphaerae bacterium]